MIFTTAYRRALDAIYGPPPADCARPDDPGAGLVVVADGVGGIDLCATCLRHCLTAAQSPHEVRVIDWTHGTGRWYADLTRTANHRLQTERLLDEVASFRARNPLGPVFLVGKSGGCGLVVRALEALPAGTVERVVLLAPALSSRYDLSEALAAVRREMVVYWSPFDLIILGAGTLLFGTIDRRRSAGAGLTGFQPPRTKSAEVYGKLRQVRWGLRMARTGYLGGHIGVDLPGFLRRHVVPLLTAEGAGKE